MHKYHLASDFVLCQEIQSWNSNCRFQLQKFLSFLFSCPHISTSKCAVLAPPAPLLPSIHLFTFHLESSRKSYIPTLSLQPLGPPFWIHILKTNISSCSVVPTTYSTNPGTAIMPVVVDSNAHRNHIPAPHHVSVSHHGHQEHHGHQGVPSRHGGPSRHPGGGVRGGHGQRHEGGLGRHH